MIQVRLMYPDGRSAWAHLPQVPSEGDWISIAHKTDPDEHFEQYKVRLVHWDLHAGSKGVEGVPDGRVALTIATLALDAR